MKLTPFAPGSAPAADAGVEVGAEVRVAIIDELLDARHVEHTAQLQQVWMAVQWAHAHPAPVDADGVVTDYAGWGDPGLLSTDESRVLVPIAGPGAPLVSPLAALELGRRWAGPTTTPASSSATPSSWSTGSHASGRCARKGGCRSGWRGRSHAKPTTCPSTRSPTRTS